MKVFSAIAACTLLVFTFAGSSQSQTDPPGAWQPSASISTFETHFFDPDDNDRGDLIFSIFAGKIVSARLDTDGDGSTDRVAMMTKSGRYLFYSRNPQTGRFENAPEWTFESDKRIRLAGETMAKILSGRIVSPKSDNDTTASGSTFSGSGDDFLLMVHFFASGERSDQEEKRDFRIPEQKLRIPELTETNFTFALTADPSPWSDSNSTVSMRIQALSIPSVEKESETFDRVQICAEVKIDDRAPLSFCSILAPGAIRADQVTVPLNFFDESAAGTAFIELYRTNDR